MIPVDRSLIPAGSRVLCAVSGGADSMCLLQLLCQRGDITVCAAHYEHGLRGEESRRDAVFVEQACARRGICCVVEHGDVAGAARESGRGIEETARDLRYAFLERTADRLGCDLIATAHNAEDNAETMLMDLCRGAGTAGLSGIPSRRGRVVRPLLNCTRQQILDFLREEGVEHVEDSSNADEQIRRNRIRRQVMPLLREMYPRFPEAAGRAAALLRQDEDCLAGLARAFIREHFDGESVPTDALLALHPAVSSRVLRQLCPRSLEREHVEAALRFCAGEGLGALDLPGIRLHREQGRLYLADEGHSQLPKRPLREGESLALPEAGLVLTPERTVYRGEIHDLFKTLLFKYESICGTLYCTGRLPGDRIRPQGRGCGKSLRALFREAGMTQRQRDLTPVLRDEKGILAALGFPADERARPEPGDEILMIHIKKL